jgi:predicted acyl esterase
MRSQRCRFGPFWLLAACVFVLAWAKVQMHAWGSAKQTAMVVMADKVKLATDVYLPDGKGPFPVILIRTPYDKNALAPIGTGAAQRGYAVVVQDTRGRYASEGENLPFVGDFWAEHRDGYDTLEWIAGQSWCSGKIGTWGGSALGITQLGMAGTGTTRLTCQHIMVGSPSFYRYGTFPGGVFKKSMIEEWLKATRHAPESLARWTKHSDYDDFWKQQDLTTRWDRVNAPAVHLGGWYDIFSQGTIDAFVGYQTKGGPKARGAQKLIMGPWVHGALQGKAGELTFPQGAAPPNNVHDAWNWFDANLKGIDNGITRLPAVTYYVMGDVTDRSAPGNVWRTADTWPPVKANPTHYYLHAGRSLTTVASVSDRPLTYAYDPHNPVPTVGGPQLTLPAGPMDQRKIETRADVLTFTSEPLTQPLEVTGRVEANLWASSDARDTDFFVKLCDIYPDGRSINICEGQLRARFHEGIEKERLMKPGQTYPFAIDLWSTSMIFNRGHRLRVLVTSSSAPGYDPNPNTGEPFRADSRTRVAHNTLYLDGKRASYLLLPVVPNR